MKKSLISLIFLFSLLLYPSLIHAAPAPVIIDYELPYPGILPDNPIYLLKTIRDNITGFLIGKPLKKAEFNLIKSDTRVSAAITLIEQKKSASLAINTLSEAEDYFSEALKKTRDAKDQGMDTREFVKRLALANQKHEEITKKIEEKIGTKDKNKFEIVKKRLQASGREIKKIR